MRSRRDPLRAIRRWVIGVGTFLFSWGFVGVVPVSLPFSLQELAAIALPRLDWLRQPQLSAASSPLSAIPEPASWALMIAGLLMVGSALRSYPRRFKLAR